MHSRQRRRLPLRGQFSQHAQRRMSIGVKLVCGLRQDRVCGEERCLALSRISNVESGARRQFHLGSGGRLLLGVGWIEKPDITTRREACAIIMSWENLSRPSSATARHRSAPMP